MTIFPFASGNYSHLAATAFENCLKTGANRLIPQILHTGDYLTSPDDRYICHPEPDGDLTLSIFKINFL